MREVRFRAWDKLTQKYWNIENWHFEDEYLDLIESGVSIADPNSERVWRKLNEVDLMQYTGLKDLNGKPIYENDVLKSEGGNIEVVIYIDGRFEPVFWYDEENCEVIGNIHENPELLEAD